MSDQNYYSLSWNSYQRTMCSHFTSLQQSGDFVDMTIAAEGHLVKVHQLIMGTASPYIKELIKSASCQHPVIFLNNVSYKTLSNILQYIYTGEVSLLQEQIPTFLETAKSLQISGINDANVPFLLENDVDDNESTIEVPVNSDVMDKEDDTSMPIISTNVTLADNTKDSIETSHSIISAVTKDNDLAIDFENCEIISITENDAKKLKKDLLPTNTRQKINVPPITSNELQYTVSTRGAVQLILNRYIYNLFSKCSDGVVRKWRCVDYRDKKCPACTVTERNFVVKRISMHNHPYHDKKILDKLKKKGVFSALKLTNVSEKNKLC